ncbi:hypothetical protein BDN71DRAFT_838885 [Pleurotus eryngii]|uniref:YDG domain-containing protein n=1 Tax=Pleurotus eryngii TaxID=5323 RepID=A0A9P6A725_PLEER|nr:hypothetical protein BDN71DRAFT_838885 [Pleurotus eryngii]
MFRIHANYPRDLQCTKVKRMYIVNSVVLYGGYEDNVDEGEEIGAEIGKAVKSSWAECCSEALRRDDSPSCQSCYRVHTGFNYAPRPGGKYKFRYDGLYVVDKWWEARGKAGCKMCMFRLKRFNDGTDMTYLSPLTRIRYILYGGLGRTST